MSDDPRSGGMPLAEWPWFWWDWFRYGARLAPRELNQPILPGWVFAGAVTINEQNSSAPETEREIVAAQSYGRQIGRMSDALAALIGERPEGEPQTSEMREFLRMRAEVEEIKTRMAARRAERFLDDLARVKREDPGAFHRLADQVRRLEAEG
jgi:hypothetical protein